jgi:hypothetical protein
LQLGFDPTIEPAKTRAKGSNSLFCGKGQGGRGVFCRVVAELPCALRGLEENGRFLKKAAQKFLVTLGWWR